MVEVMFNLVFFPKKETPCCIRGNCITSMYICVLSEEERGYCVRVKRKLQQICYRLYLFILLDNIKGRIGCFSVDVAQIG